MLHVLTLSVDPQRNEVVLEWASVEGANYRIQSTPAVDGAWSDLGNSVAGGEETTQANVDLPPGESQRYFRIVLAQE